VRARCERTAVEPCQVTFDEMAEFGSVMPILSTGVGWGRAVGWVCKPEVAGSSPARSITYLQISPFVLSGKARSWGNCMSAPPAEACETRLWPQIPAGLSSGHA
jgi:hypothetical protein